jgi:hypothetical protein
MGWMWHDERSFKLTIFFARGLDDEEDDRRQGSSEWQRHQDATGGSASLPIQMTRIIQQTPKALLASLSTMNIGSKLLTSTNIDSIAKSCYSVTCCERKQSNEF